MIIIFFSGWTASKAAEILAGLQSFLFYTETTFAQFQNIRRHVKATGKRAQCTAAQKRHGELISLKLRPLSYDALTEASHKL